MIPIGSEEGRKHRRIEGEYRNRASDIWPSSDNQEGSEGCKAREEALSMIPIGSEEGRKQGRIEVEYRKRESGV